MVFILPWEVGKEEELGMISRLVINERKTIAGGCRGGHAVCTAQARYRTSLVVFFFAEQRRTYAGIELIRTYIYIHLFCVSCKGIENSLAHILTTFIWHRSPSNFFRAKRNRKGDSSYSFLKLKLFESSSNSSPASVRSLNIFETEIFVARISLRPLSNSSFSPTV